MADEKVEKEGDFPTILGADAVFTGKLQFEKGVRLLGKFEGEIMSGGQLLIDNGAALNGDVKAQSIKIEGNVKGNLDAGAKVQLSQSARVEGDVHAARLEVAEGAVLVGHCTVGVNGQARAAEPQNKSASTVKSDSGGSGGKAKVAAVGGNR